MGALDTMMQGGAPGFSFEELGDAIIGVVVEIDERQDSVYLKPDKLKWWNRDPGPASGNPADRPVMIPIFTIQSDLRDSEEDDGVRSVWCRGNCFSAVKQAIKAAFPGVRKVTDEMVIGGTLKIQYHAKGEAKNGLNPAKLFRAKFERRSIVSDNSEPDSDAYDERNPPPPKDW